MNQSLINQEGITKCLEYVENGKESFKEIVKSLNVKIDLIGTRRYFDEDTESRNVYKITVRRDGKQISFKFGDSINHTLEGIEPDLYDVLTTISAEYDFNNTEFEEFCSEFGYNTDSRKAEKTFKLWKKQNTKLHKLFTDEEIQVFPS